MTIVKCQTEDQEQMQLVKYLQCRRLLFYHVPNGSNRSMAYTAKLKCLGLSPGVPDICIPIPRLTYHGLYLELKRKKGGVVSDSQKYWIAELRKQGYRAEVCRGADKAIEVIEEYLMKA